ncbi:NADPH:quinone reductase-like Zn-dependent oxidoreductase [Nonomuraea polychroma]|uniref:NADPH:quinone reductase-like Zn-dependent oxidoreductase n=1 Tax=Nonomuraea polychroma TaxID=46176 RepID=A0A438M7I2_9ACTN|nr:NAD(P)-dependent alcohol dehydrogenase [Nonomuraea polychroma]RVX41679.1 NADPH:quinone reductase-like Zn-dependent oxidoreductase [Nonomuraea polychroma]
MKAFVLRSYGPPAALQLVDVDRPEPGPGEVLVRVRATSVQPFDWHLMRGEPYVARVMPGGPGLRKPSITILGADVAGEVEAAGKDVTEFAPGDEVFAMSKQGGFGEYVRVSAAELAPKPRNLSFEEAAAVPLAANTALVAVRDRGGVQPGQKVLVNGASGGVGTFAVQLAKAFGAHVTGVCSSRNVDLVRSLGADEVVDYTKEDFTRLGRRFDLVVDNASSRGASAYRRVLKPKGVHVLVGGPGGRWLQPAGRMFATLAAGLFLPHKVALADVIACTAEENRRNLVTLTRLIEDGQVNPVIDRQYPFEEIPAAIRYQEEGRAPGKVVVTVSA